MMYMPPEVALKKANMNFKWLQNWNNLMKYSQKHAGVVNLEMFISINFHQDMV